MHGLIIYSILFFISLIVFLFTGSPSCLAGITHSLHLLRHCFLPFTRYMWNLWHGSQKGRMCCLHCFLLPAIFRIQNTLTQIQKNNIGLCCCLLSCPSCQSLRL